MTQNAMTAFEQQTKISLLKLFLLLKKMNLAQMEVKKYDVIELFGNCKRWRDCWLSKENRETLLLVGHDISFTTEQIKLLCEQALLIESQQTENDCPQPAQTHKKSKELLLKTIEENLGWQPIGKQ